MVILLKRLDSEAGIEAGSLLLQADHMEAHRILFGTPTLQWTAFSLLQKLR